MWALGAVPAFAPKGENHLLRSSSPVQRVSYWQQAVTYRTFNPQAAEVLRLNFKPTRVLADDVVLVLRKDLKGEGYTVQPLEAGYYVVRVRHLRSNQVSVTAK
jgi:hypothetical protein